MSPSQSTSGLRASAVYPSVMRAAPASARARNPSRFRTCPAKSPPTDQPVLIVISESPAVVASVPRPHWTRSGTCTSAPNIAAPEKNAAAEPAANGISREEAERQERIRRAPLGPHEPRETEGGDGERAELAGAEPAVPGRAGLEHGEHEAGHAREKRERARQVERPAGDVLPGLRQACPRPGR